MRRINYKVMYDLSISTTNNSDSTIYFYYYY